MAYPSAYAKGVSLDIIAPKPNALRGRQAVFGRDVWDVA